MSDASKPTSERLTTLGGYFMSAGIITGWITCSLFWLWMGWLP